MTFPLDFGLQLSLPMTLPETKKTTLWMGDLDPWMDEQYITQVWYNLGEKVMVKVIRDKVTSASAGYAFVDFGSTTSAAAALSAFNGTTIPNIHKSFRLNWASGGGLIDRREDRQPEYSIFVGDLSPECTEPTLLSAFATRYRSCKSAKIMTDSRTGISRGYGFVRFGDPVEHQRTLVEMQGCFIHGRPVRVSMATPKQQHHSQHQQLQTQTQQQQQQQPSSQPPPQQQLQQAQAQPFVQCQQQQQQQQPPPPSSSSLSTPPKSPVLDPHNTTVFVGGLSTPINEEELRQYFAPFGDIVYTKIPPGKGCGFVQYVSRLSAEKAILYMNGFQIGTSRIRLSWGRSQNDKSAAAAAATAAAAQASRQQQQQQQQQSAIHSLGSTSATTGSSLMPARRLPPPKPMSSLDWVLGSGGLGNGGNTNSNSSDQIFGPLLFDTTKNASTSSPWTFSHVYAQ